MPNPAFNIREAAQSSEENALEKPSVMESFKDRVNKFWQTYTQLQTKENEVPESLKSEYKSVMERGERIRVTLESITNSYEAAGEWISDIFGFSGSRFGLDGVRWSDTLSGNLGAIQFVPLAVIATASSLIVKWLKDAYTIDRKLNEIKRLESQGYDSDRASEIANRTISGPGFFNIAGFDTKPIIVIGLLAGGLWFANSKGWLS